MNNKKQDLFVYFHRKLILLRYIDLHPRRLLLFEELGRRSWQMFEKPTLQTNFGRIWRKYRRYWAVTKYVSAESL
jgi:hypothetical protein